VSGSIMISDSTIYGGFDLTFIDIDIRPIESETQDLIIDFPKIGSHHRNTRIVFRPGGNGFNLCRTLAHLGRRVTYVGPSSEQFEQIVKRCAIPIEILPIKDAKVNYTAILNTRNGEIQLNSVEGFLSYEHLDDILLEKYVSSPLKSISNVALNPTSIEWICSLLLSLGDIDLSKEENRKLSPTESLHRLDDTSFDGIMLIDPSDISHFLRIKEFAEILNLIKKFKGEKYLSLNEYELNSIQTVFSKNPEDLAAYLQLPIIFHTAKEVRYYGKEFWKIPTKKLESQMTFVGAGDCFNGAFLHQIFNSASIRDSLEFAIESASHLIETGNYPTS